MAAGNLDSADLKAVAFGGLIHEDVMNKIWDISKIPLPFTDSIGSGDGVKNSYTEWTQDRLADPNTSNAKVDGADTIGDQDTRTGKRVGNHCQISTKTVKVSTRARQSDTIGRSDELPYQVMMRQRELRRDVEAISLSNQGSQADDGNTTPGNAGSFPAWISTSKNQPGDATGGTGFANGTVAAYGPGTARAPKQSELDDLIQDVYIKNGDPTILMSVPTIIKGFSQYMVSANAGVVPLRSETGQSASAITAKNSVGVYMSQHGQVMAIVSNRLQPTYNDATPSTPKTAAHVLVYDPDYVRHGFLHGYRVEPLSKTGLSDNRQMAVDWTVKALNEEAHGRYSDIDVTQAWTAS